MVGSFPKELECPMIRTKFPTLNEDEVRSIHVTSIQYADWTSVSRDACMGLKMITLHIRGFGGR